ncbi:MAG: RNA 2',3'-cyclic phosphodiesterase [Bacteroidetes bacterium]|nr:RNA 2',3'-cyclic phosphodiesterase [Bacteroidota bacterium]
MEICRTFIGVPLRVGDEFLRAREALMERLAGERISWVDPERYHVTIRFIGDTLPESFEAIRSALRKRVGIPCISMLNLHRAGSFGPRKKPRVVWVGFEKALLFEILKNEVDDALDSCGIPPVDQPFRAHLTLGRVRSLKDLSAYYSAIDSMKSLFSGKVSADRLVFYRSDLGPGGPVYTPLEEIIFSNQAL